MKEAAVPAELKVIQKKKAELHHWVENELEVLKNDDRTSAIAALVDS